MKAMKRILLCLLAMVMLTAALPVYAQEAEEAEEKELTLEERITADYYSALAGSEKESLGGFCGLMTSWQLHLMGINKYLLTFDGNQQYDYYSTLHHTTGGYRVKAYPAQDYTLEEALYAVTDYGNRNAYNLVVGFQWTNTEAGATYGHAVVVYAIEDGLVYFTEGFQTSLGTAEGEAIAITIPEFVKYYDDWTVFEGVIEFGKKDISLEMKTYPANFYGVVQQPAGLYNQPETVQEELRLLRTVPAGERLYVTGLLEDSEGRYFYRVDDSGTEGYISAKYLTVEQLCSEDITAADATAPEVLKQGEEFRLSGTVSSVYSKITGVSAVVTDEMGRQKLTYTAEEEDGAYTVGGYACDAAMKFSSLSEGEYHYVLYVTYENDYVEDGKLVRHEEQIPLQSKTFYIGTAPEKQPAEAAQSRQIVDGWTYRQGRWYYYKDAEPYHGWLSDNGVDYYLQEDGSVTTGWVVINGKERFFSNTGAMRTGWIDRGSERYYLLRNGVAAVGWHEIDAKRYCFSESGALIREGWFEEDGFRYYIELGGTAVTDGWYTLPEGRFFFHSDGRALMQSIGEDGVQHIVILGRKLQVRAKCLIEP